MSKNESNSQHNLDDIELTLQRNKSLTCQRTKAIHNYWPRTTRGNCSGTNLLHVKERKQFTTTGPRCTPRTRAEQISYMSKNESNSQLWQISWNSIGKRNKSLTCQRTKAIHNVGSWFTVSSTSGTNLLHVKERKQFTTGQVKTCRPVAAEQISYMSKNESNSQRKHIVYKGVCKRNKSLTCQRTKAIHNRDTSRGQRQRSGTNLLHVKERKQFTTYVFARWIFTTAEQISYMSKNESNSQHVEVEG